jgi:hypothetical protein
MCVPIAALKARMWVAQGRLGEALGWAREQGLSAHDDLSYLREFEHITLAGCSWPDTRAIGKNAPCTRQWDYWSASCKRRKKAGGWERDRDPGAAGSRSRGARRRALLRLCLWNVP